MDELEDEQIPIKSPIKRYGSTRKIYLFNSKYKRLAILKFSPQLTSSFERRKRKILFASPLNDRKMFHRVKTIFCVFFRAGCMRLVNHKPADQCKYFSNFFSCCCWRRAKKKVREKSRLAYTDFNLWAIKTCTKGKSIDFSSSSVRAHENRMYY